MIHASLKNTPSSCLMPQAYFLTIELVHSEPLPFPRIARERVARILVWQSQVDLQEKVGTQPLCTIHMPCLKNECNLRAHFSQNLQRCWMRSKQPLGATVMSVRIVPESEIRLLDDRSTKQVRQPTRTLSVSCGPSFLFPS